MMKARLWMVLTICVVLLVSLIIHIAKQNTGRFRTESGQKSLVKQLNIISHVAPIARTVVLPESKPVSVALVKPSEPPVARVVVGEKVFRPGYHGAHFEPIAIARSQKVPVTVAWAANDPSVDVLVHAIDGGRIDGKGNAKRFALTDSKQVQFTFDAPGGEGRFQVLLRRGVKEEVLELFVPTSQMGKEPYALR